MVWQHLHLNYVSTNYGKRTVKCGANCFHVWKDSFSLSYSTPGPVDTGMGDRMGVQLLVQEINLSLTIHSGQLSLAIPPWVGAMSTGQRAVMLCDWGVNADMVLFAGNTVWSISERVRGVCAKTRYTNPRILYFTLHSGISQQLLMVYMMSKFFLFEAASLSSN